MIVIVIVVCSSCVKRVLIAQQIGVVCVSVSYRFTGGRGILQVPCLSDSSCCKRCPKSILILFHFSCDYSTSREKLVWLGSLEDGSFKKWHILMIGSFFFIKHNPRHLFYKVVIRWSTSLILIVWLKKWTSPFSSQSFLLMWCTRVHWYVKVGNCIKFF